MTAIQRNPDEMVGILAGQFQKRYEPNFGWAMARAYAELPCLRGFWPMGACDSAGSAIDQSGLGMTLAPVDVPLFGYADLAPWAWFLGNDGFLRADDPNFDILGNEGYVWGYDGLTVGGWWKFSNAPAATEVMIAKAASVGPDYAYQLQRNPAGTISFMVATAPGAWAATVTSTTVPTTGRWFFAMGTYKGLAARVVQVTVDAERASVAGPAPPLNNSAAGLSLAMDGSSANFMTGYCSNVFVTACFLYQYYDVALGSQLRPLYGV